MARICVHVGLQAPGENGGDEGGEGPADAFDLLISGGEGHPAADDIGGEVEGVGEDDTSLP